jgi:hypothetical protein
VKHIFISRIKLYPIQHDFLDDKAKENWTPFRLMVFDDSADRNHKQANKNR